MKDLIRKILKEIRVPRSERVELYKDENIIVVVPLTHRALQKYAHECQWCINSDLYEWEDYHKGKHAVIIQRNPNKPKIGIKYPIPSEIFTIEHYTDIDSIYNILGYRFSSNKERDDYMDEVTSNIDNFATNIVYYSPSGSLYDQEDNYLPDYGYSISDIPNVTPEVIHIMDDFLQNEEMVTESEIIKSDVSNLCNKMSVKTYEEGVKILNNVIGAIEENPDEWEKIKKPLSMWKEVTIQLRDELKTGMTGDSEVDESNTWWAAIQSTLCPKMESIIKESNDTHIKYMNYVIDDFLKNSEVISNNPVFNSIGELRDLGWDDEMVDFAYSQYERFGFKQDSEDEDSYYHEGNPDYQWSLDEMLMDMFYNFIDEGVKKGEFIEYEDYWEINENEWVIKTKDRYKYNFQWFCGSKSFSINTDDWDQIDITLSKEYAVPEKYMDIFSSGVLNKMKEMLNNVPKYCL